MSSVHVFALLSAMAAFATANTVVDLTDATFDQFVTSHEVVMIEFYAPWCSACQDIAPVFEQTASAYETTKDIKFGRIDCVTDESLCQRYETPVYPTFRVFKGLGEEEIYNGPRTQASFIEAVEWFWLPEPAVDKMVDVDQEAIEGTAAETSVGMRSTSLAELKDEL